MQVPANLERRIRKFIEESKSKSGDAFEESLFAESSSCKYSLVMKLTYCHFVELVLSGGVDYAKQNGLLEVANLVLFD
jgi:hypothetical protein